jgi:RNA polymerase sigma-70 factor (ECF subfamily)
MPADAADRLLVARIRGGEQTAWQECIERFEGRLLAFAESRIRNRATSEDIVQDTFLGFLTALPNYDDNTPLESFLFAIAAHKLTDVLRRQGRRPVLSGISSGSDGSGPEPVARGRVASSMARSRELRSREEQVIADCLRDLIRAWLERGELERLCCIELLFVQGHANKDAAARLGISEQAVANHKFFVVAKLKEAATRARLQDFNPAELGLE